MALTYATKRAIIDHLSNKAAWKNLHDQPTPHDNFNRIVYGHQITFDDNAPEFDLLTALKLVIAYDFDLEPSLEVSTNKNFAYVLQLLQHLDSEMVEPDQIEGWNDTTDIEGDRIGISKVFRIYNHDGVVDVRLTLDGREAIWSQTEVLNNALNASDVPPIQLISFDNMPRTILHLLKDGHEIKDHRQNDWVYRILHNIHSAEFAKQARIHAHKSFHVKGDEFSAICVDKGVAVVAMIKDVLQHNLRHYRPLFPGMV